MACGPNIYHFPSAQIVLLESPLVSGPGRNGKPICLACYRLLHCYTSPSMRCSDGSWSISSPEVTDEILEVVSSAVLAEREPALGTNLKMKIRTELVGKSVSLP